MKDVDSRKGVLDLGLIWSVYIRSVDFIAGTGSFSTGN